MDNGSDLILGSEEFSPGWPNPTQPGFDGKLADFRIYHRLLSTTELTALQLSAAPLTGNIFEADVPGAVAQFTREDGGDAVVDKTATVADGSLENGAAWTDTQLPPALFIDWAMDLDGVNDHVDLGDQDEFDIGTEDFSFAMWLEPDAAPPSGKSRRLVSTGDATGGGYELQWSTHLFGGSQKLELTLRDNSGNAQDLEYTLPEFAGTDWHHVAFTIEQSGDVKLYWDGAEVASQAYSRTGTVSNEGGLLLGDGASSSVLHFNGRLADVRVFHRVLSAGDVSALQTNAVPGPNLVQSQVVEHLYDVHHHWIGKQVDTDGDGDVDVTERYVYDGDQIVYRFVDEDAVGQAGHTEAEADELANRFLWGQAVDQLFAQENVDDLLSSDVEDVKWALTDNLGTIRDLVEYDEVADATSVVNHLTYEAFGAITGQTNIAQGGAPVESFFEYTAKPFDDHTGLQQSWHRWYDPTTGQWTTIDYIEADIPNTYRYVGNNPTNAIDPTGLDKIEVKGTTVVWANGRRKSRWMNIGTVGKNGWVNIDPAFGGGRATRSALDKAARSSSFWEGRNPRSSIQDAIDGVRSPFNLRKGSNNIGIFIDGTSNHLESITNVARFYNVYDGTKFYYGGVGNPVDFSGGNTNWLGQGERIGGGAGQGWDAILDRAVADVADQWEEGKSVDIVGFSRGAAMANELARRLQKKSIPVRFLGMFDPVYSYGLPGQGTFGASQSYSGFMGNYVTTSVPGNVAKAHVIYAEHEVRSWFPATKFTQSSGTRLTTTRSPGRHGDIGGHWQSNPLAQAMTLHNMVAAAAGVGVSTTNRGIDPAIAASLISDYTLSITQDQFGDNAPVNKTTWDKMKIENWDILSAQEYRSSIANASAIAWQPFVAGVQKNDPINWAFPLVNFSALLLTGIQPQSAGYKRSLPFAQSHLQDLYGGARHSFFLELGRRNPAASGQVGWAK